MSVFQGRNSMCSHNQNSRKILVVVVVILNYAINYLRCPDSSFDDMNSVSEILLPFFKTICGFSETSILGFIRYDQHILCCVI